VTNKGSVLPIAYYKLTSEICRLGLASRQPLEVRGQTVIPYDFAVAFIKKERERILKETQFGQQRGAMSIVIKGNKDGEELEYRLHTFSSTLALGEGTGIPAAVGAIMMQQGKISGKGVIPPEGGIKPREFIDVYRPLIAAADAKIGKDGETSLIIERVDAHGNVTTMDL
jgi:saccharopine dehydrogenase (NAD+, L-lysine-forming)